MANPFAQACRSPLAFGTGEQKASFEAFTYSLDQLLSFLQDLATQARNRQQPNLDPNIKPLGRGALVDHLVDLDQRCVAALAQDDLSPEERRWLIDVLSLTPCFREIGQYCLSLAWKAHRLEFLLPTFLLGPLDGLAVECSGMTFRALDAFRLGDAELAQAVVEQDEWVDGIYHRLRSKALQRLFQDPSQAMPTQALVDLAKHWEMLSDAAVELAERTLRVYPAATPRRSSALPA